MHYSSAEHLKGVKSRINRLSSNDDTSHEADSDSQQGGLQKDLMFNEAHTICVKARMLAWGLTKSIICKPMSDNRFFNLCRHKLQITKTEGQTHLTSINNRMQTIYFAFGGVFGDEIINHCTGIWRLLTIGNGADHDIWRTEFWTTQWLNAFRGGTCTSIDKIPENRTAQFCKVFGQLQNLRALYDWLLKLQYYKRFSKASMEDNRLEALGQIDISVTLLLIMFEWAKAMYEMDMCSRTVKKTKRVVTWHVDTEKFMKHCLCFKRGLPSQVLFHEVDDLNVVVEFDTSKDLMVPLKTLCQSKEAYTLIMMHILGFHMKVCAFWEVLYVIMNGAWKWDFTCWHLGWKNLMSVWKNIVRMHHGYRCLADVELPMGKTEYYTKKNNGEITEIPIEEPQYDWEQASWRSKTAYKIEQLGNMLIHSIASENKPQQRSDLWFQPLISLALENNVWTWPRSTAWATHSNWHSERVCKPLGKKVNWALAKIDLNKCLCNPKQCQMLRIEDDKESRSNRLHVLENTIKVLRWPWNVPNWSSTCGNEFAIKFWKFTDVYFALWPNKTVSDQQVRYWKVQTLRVGKSVYGTGFQVSHGKQAKFRQQTLYPCTLRACRLYGLPTVEFCHKNEPCEGELVDGCDAKSVTSEVSLPDIKASVVMVGNQSKQKVEYTKTPAKTTNLADRQGGDEVVEMFDKHQDYVKHLVSMPMAIEVSSDSVPTEVVDLSRDDDDNDADDDDDDDDDDVCVQHVGRNARGRTKDKQPKSGAPSPVRDFNKGKFDRPPSGLHMLSGSSVSTKHGPFVDKDSFGNFAGTNSRSEKSTSKKTNTTKTSKQATKANKHTTNTSLQVSKHKRKSKKKKSNSSNKSNTEQHYTTNTTNTTNTTTTTTSSSSKKGKKTRKKRDRHKDHAEERSPPPPPNKRGKHSQVHQPQYRYSQGSIQRVNPNGSNNNNRKNSNNSNNSNPVERIGLRPGHVATRHADVCGIRRLHVSPNGNNGNFGVNKSSAPVVQVTEQQLNEQRRRLELLTRQHEEYKALIQQQSRLRTAPANRNNWNAPMESAINEPPPVTEEAQGPYDVKDPYPPKHR